MSHKPETPVTFAKKKKPVFPWGLKRNPPKTIWPSTQTEGTCKNTTMAQGQVFGRGRKLRWPRTFETGQEWTFKVMSACRNQVPWQPHPPGRKEVLCCLPLPNLKAAPERTGVGGSYLGAGEIYSDLSLNLAPQQRGSGLDESTGVFSQCPDLSPPQTSDTLQAIHGSGAWATLWFLLLPNQVQKTTLPTPKNGETQTSTEGEGKRSALFLAGDFFRWKPHVGSPLVSLSEGAGASFRDNKMQCVCDLLFWSPRDLENYLIQVCSEPQNHSFCINTSSGSFLSVIFLSLPWRLCWNFLEDLLGKL